MVGRGRKEKDLMVGQISFYVFCCCVVRMDGFVQNRINEFVQRQLRRQDGWFCAKLDGWAWAATFWPFLAVFTTQQHHRLNMARHDMKYVWYKGCSQFNDTPPKF